MYRLALHRTALLLAGACLPLLAGAQGERWYQVELLIFSHEDTVTSEQWEPLPELAYPSAGRFLLFPEANEARLREYRAEAQLMAAGPEDGEFEVASETDEFGRQFIRIIPVTEESAPGINAPDIPQVDATAGSAAAATGPTGRAVDALPLLPTPFVALPRSRREFDGKAAYMRRTGYYETLFHETWVQPVAEEERAVPLILDRSGDDRAWPRLQGSVKLHLSRYLHIETRLWLNTPGDYLPGLWRMPPPPLGPVSVIIEKPEPPEVEELAPYYLEAQAGEPAAEVSPDEEEPVGEIAPVYTWRHAVPLTQTRRMRSNEVHYIDHPLLGVVVKLTPLDEEQLQLLAEEEVSRAESRVQP